MEHFLCKGDPCTVWQRGQKILSGEYNGFTLAFDHVIWKSIGIIYSLEVTTVPSLKTCKGVCLTLTYEYWTSKSTSNIYSHGIIPVPSLAILNQRGKKAPYPQIDQQIMTCKLFQCGLKLWWNNIMKYSCFVSQSRLHGWIWQCCLWNFLLYNQCVTWLKYCQYGVQLYPIN